MDIQKIFAGMGKKEKQVLVLSAVGTVAFLIAYFNLLLIPQLSGLFRNAAEAHKVNSELKAASQAIAGMGRLRSDITASAEKIGRYADMLPTEEGIPTLLESLADMARSSSMKIVSIVPAPSKELSAQRSQAYRAIPIVISARAGFHELGRFMSTLENSGRLMKIADINVKENKASPKKHDVELVVLTYVLTVGK
jgi:type IV pilus assembly protein PilO